ncbi:related to anther-expressed protein SLL2-S9 [Ramularia collo-cygni]|uniref:Protein-lysine N-methyltransferase EFM4 n=1 Tax=Ramularia collo-cygni TaxID=112498 RepID=A0A2D3UU39_9PEZI|nr:related to anther-expressed protein SLL2-S9 [Ramularia collo-cygni]CZT18618.1 related to anther-expressed protein SLL2-S9 [Ramularia collo-cygni]
MADDIVSPDAAPRARKLLDPSELGTKEYWEAAYVREIENHEGDADDEGIVWFDESNAEDTVLKKLSTYDSQGRGHLDRKHCRFLDLGTGNGHMLFALRDDEDDDGARWTGEMVGVDYSPASVQLARQVNIQRLQALDEERGEEDSGELARIVFEQWDLLCEPPGTWLGEGFDVVLDKGTFDAISLMPHSGQSPHPCEIYREKVTALIKPGSFLFITSCNWTKEELLDWLACEGSQLTFYDEAKYPTFTFGGQTGQSVVTAIFRREG